MKKMVIGVSALLLSLILIGAAAYLSMRYEDEEEQDINDLDPGSVEVMDVVTANNEFAFDMYMKLSEEGGNMFISPWSIYTALSMTYEGARGNTADEMREVLHLHDNDTSRRIVHKGLAESINEDSEVELNTANSIWPQEDYHILPEYVQIIEDVYKGNAQELDYINDPEGSRETINDWVEQKTNDRIKDLIPQGAIDPLVRLVLTNAIYFKGDWKYQFDEDLTIDGDFHLEDGGSVEVPMMHMTGTEERFSYMENDHLQMIELPYDGEKVSMFIL
ncbi:MAG: serpin family protein, partial [Thermoplasmatota archaeon]